VIKHLETLAESNADKYRANKPFPHIAIDNFLPEDVLLPVLEAFPDPEQLKWIKYNNPDEKKLAFSAVEKLPPVPREFLLFLNSSPVLQFLEKLTGIEGLIADPYFVGGGLHQIEPGGKLEMHADFNKHTKLNLDRRLNLLVYLNRDWKEEYGGHLELWDESMTRCEQKILPVFNRCVVFSTTSKSFHGHPTPLSCPPDRTRKSVATYYYTNGRPEEEVGEAHSTLFKSRPGAEKERRSAAYTAKKVLLAITPPIISDTVYSLRHRNSK
jgi:hypothetical protein